MVLILHTTLCNFRICHSILTHDAAAKPSKLRIVGNFRRPRTRPLVVFSQLGCGNRLRVSCVRESATAQHTAEANAHNASIVSSPLALGADPKDGGGAALPSFRCRRPNRDGGRRRREVY